MQRTYSLFWEHLTLRLLCHVRHVCLIFPMINVGSQCLTNTKKNQSRSGKVRNQALVPQPNWEVCCWASPTPPSIRRLRRGSGGARRAGRGSLGGSVARWIPLVRLPERPIYLHSQGLGHHLGENISSSVELFCWYEWMIKELTLSYLLFWWNVLNSFHQYKKSSMARHG